LGLQTTFVLAGCVGAAVTLGAPFVHGMRDVEAAPAPVDAHA
jgi:hypothetical protein